MVCATGNYARQTGRLFGLNVPSIPVEHQYIVYDESPDLKAYRKGGGRELAVLRESDQSYYLREERMGWILGPYEAGAPARFADGVPDWFGKSLFEGDLGAPAAACRGGAAPRAVARHLRHQRHRQRPHRLHAGRQPAHRPRVGARNLWLNEAHSFGITAAGGSGWQLAEWIVEGEPGIDMMAVDPRRYGPYTSKRYVVQKNEETYRNVFVIHFPDEERRRCAAGQDQPDLRQARSAWAPCSASVTAGSAPIGSRRPASSPRTNGVSAARIISSTWAVKRVNLRQHVGVIDLTPFTKHEVTGPGAEAWLDGLVANKVPTKIGRMALSHALTRRGGIRSEFTITKIADAAFLRGERGRGGALRQRLSAADAAAGRQRHAAQHHVEPRLLRGGGAALARRAGETRGCAARQRGISLAHGPGDARSGSRRMCICCG